MLTLSRGSRRAGSSEPMPAVFQSLWDAGMKPRYGQVTMISAQPNAGKSAFALSLAISWVRDHGLWGYYFSADTDEGDMKRRACAALTDTPMDVVEREMAESEEMEAWYEERLEVLKDLRWAFKTDPDIEFMQNELEAFKEAYGAHPDFVIVDNLVNLVGYAAPNDKSGLLEQQLGLKYLAREHGFGVLLLHHASESSGDPTSPPARQWIQGKVSEIPEQVFTAAYDADRERFGVAGVKLRGAKADPKAERPVWLDADIGRLHFKDHIEVYQPRIPEQDRWRWDQ